MNRRDFVQSAIVGIAGAAVDPSLCIRARAQEAGPANATNPSEARAP